MITLIDPNSEEFEDVWAKAVPQLTRLSLKYPEAIDWNPEYILATIDNAGAALMACDDGFYIVRDNGPHLDIWIAAAFEGQVDILAEKTSELFKIAVESGFETLTFSTVRRGWEKVAERAGFAVLDVTTTYIYRGQANEEISPENPRISTGEDASATRSESIH